MIDTFKNRKLVVVSNRLPITVSKEGDQLVYTTSSGGLATAMSSLNVDKSNMTWVGWPGIASDDLTIKDKEDIKKHLSKMGFNPVFLSSEQIDKFYSGYANDTIWPLFHYFQSYTQHSPEYWQEYQAVNKEFSEKVSQISDDDTCIWVHDYHLMLLPEMLRIEIPDATIGFFLHTPFPSYEVFRQLPNSHHLLNGLLGADLIGFHIYDYVRHFLSSVMRTLGYDSKYGVLHINGRMIKADAFPIGIDYKTFIDATKYKPTKKFQKELSKFYKGKKVILSVDRLDYSKGIIKRLEAYEQFLVNNKQYHKKVVLIVLAVPSRSDVDTYKELKKNIEITVSRINGAFSTVNWTPINYQYKNTPFNELIALYGLANVALVTPLRDGMNLVAKEYVAVNNKSSGVLILSEMAGAIDELHESIRINPNDIGSIEEAIKTALNMPRREQKDRLKRMNKRISSYTVQKWVHDFMEQLSEVKQAQVKKEQDLITQEKRDKLSQKFSNSKKRLIILDYDGTLIRLTSDFEPSKSKPSKHLVTILNKLASKKNTSLYVVSGRPHKVLDKWLGKVSKINLVAEHGAWIKHKGKWVKDPVSLDPYKKTILPIMEKITARTPGSDIEIKTTSIVWHYRKVPIELAYIRKINLLRELNESIDHTKLSIHQGSKIIEVKPKEINKGKIVSKIYSRERPDFIICAGDDYTDEDMFESLPSSAVTIKVGHEPTLAKLWTKDSEGIISILENLIEPKKGLIKTTKTVVKKTVKKISRL